MNNIPSADVSPRVQAKYSLDVEIGRQLQMLRLKHKLSQQKLGEKLKVSFQQIQKYEKGTNSISIRKLLKICDIFDVSFSYFVAEADKASRQPASIATSSTSVTRAMVVFSQLSPKVQKSVLGLLGVLQNHDDESR